MPTAISYCFYAPMSRDLLRLTGRDRATFLQGQATNDIVALAPGDGCYAFQLDATGHVLSDMRVLCAEGYLLLDLEPGQAAPVAATLDRYLIMEKCRIADVSAEMATVFVGGADALPVLQVALGITPPAAWQEGTNAPVTVFGDNALVAATVLIDGPGCTVYVARAEGDDFVAALERAGATPFSAPALDALRIAAGIPRFGVDIDSKVLAPETGQAARAISRRKGCYIGQEIVARIHARGHTNRTLAHFHFAPDASVPDALLPIEADGREVGRITSAATGPDNGLVVALGYIRHEFAEPGTAVLVAGQTAHVAALPAPAFAR